MRLRRLGLGRWGRFTDAVLDFDTERDGGVDFHILYGRNEAGKTTVLQAVSDLLFGIETRSRYNFLHDYAELRLSAAIETSDGRRLEFVRRKGTRRTLLAADGSELPDTALAPFLGSVDRDLFTTLFGLDHARLREGGARILEAQGQIGRTLFEAGSGVAGLGAVIQDFDEAAAARFTPRRVASKPFYQALDRLTQARKREREGMITAEGWRTAVDNVRRVEQELAGLRDSLAALEATRTRAERIRRVLPLLSQRAGLEQQRAPLAALPELPETVARERTDALQQRDRAQQRHAAHERALAQLDLDLAALAAAAPVLIGPLADAIRITDELYQQRRGIMDQIADIPKRDTELHQVRTQIDGLLQQIGVAIPSEQVGNLIPRRDVSAEIRALIGEQTGLQARLDAATERDAQIHADRERIARHRAAPAVSPDPALLASTVAGIKAKGALEDQQAEAATRAAQAGRRVEIGLAALTLWSHGAEALARAPVPDEATIQHFEAEQAGLNEWSRRISDRIAALTDQRDRSADALARLIGGGDIPTAAAVAEARRHRDRDWAEIRRRHIDDPVTVGAPANRGGGSENPAPAADLRPSAPARSLPDAYEAAVVQADTLADRREAEAQRIARWSELSEAQAEAERGLAAAQTEAATLAAARQVLDAAWRAAWAASGITPETPRAMVGWLARRAAVLRDHDAAVEAEAAVQRLADAITRACALITGALLAVGVAPSPPPGALPTPFATLLAQAERCAQELAARIIEGRTLDARAAELDVAANAAKRQLAASEQAITTWRQSWARAMAALGAAPDTSPAAAAARLGTLEELDRARLKIPDLSHRVARMHDNVAAFGTAVADLAGRVAPDLATLEPVEAVGRLYTRCREAEALEQQRHELTRRREIERAGRGDAARAMADADAILARLRHAAGVDDDDALALRLGQLATRRAVQRSVAAVEQQLLAAGDGRSLAALAIEAEGSDSDHLKAEIERINAEQTAINQRSTDLGGELRALTIELQAMERRHDAATAAEDAQQALASLHSIAADYGRLRGAALLLRRAVDRYRQDQQAPLLRQAGALFRRLTLEAFARLVVDYDDHDQAVLKAERSDGKRIDVQALSDGTRDQLFLALRLALVGTAMTTSEPVPFIGDDLLINFDDERSAAALTVLRDLAQRTQVLMFTHHPHLCLLAERVLGPGQFTLHGLDRA